MLLLTTLTMAALNPNWTLVWSDEFDKPGLPDPAKWVYEEGYVRNKEAQYYTKGRAENARIEDGKLIIEARKDNWEGKPITSASITTQGKFATTYGRIEARAKVPAGRGTWPAFWTLGTNIRDVGWPKCGEIDILEYVGMQPNTVHHNVHTQARNHMNNGGGGGFTTGTQYPLESAEEKFHTYAVEWFPDRLDFYLDSDLKFTYKKPGNTVDDWPFDAPQYLILNLAIGGAWGGQQGIDDTIFPARYEIDYVRVYQRKQ